MAGKSSVSTVVNQGTLTFGSSPGVEAGAIARAHSTVEFRQREVAGLAAEINPSLGFL
jgi:hypothetical protein